MTWVIVFDSNCHSSIYEEFMKDSNKNFILRVKIRKKIQSTLWANHPKQYQDSYNLFSAPVHLDNWKEKFSISL